MNQVPPEITHKEVKKISRQLRDDGSRLLNTHLSDGVDNLRRFLNFINTNQLISDYIQSQVKESGIDFSGQDLIHLSIPVDVSGEINFTYSLLSSFINQEFLDSHSYKNLAYNYLACNGGYSSKFKDCVDDFNQRVVRPFINRIEQYLCLLSIDLDPSSNSNIIHNSGTLNHISGQNIQAIQGSDNDTVIGDRHQ
jgi:hypothetical protein